MDIEICELSKKKIRMKTNKSRKKKVKIKEQYYTIKLPNLKKTITSNIMSKQ